MQPRAGVLHEPVGRQRLAQSPSFGRDNIELSRRPVEHSMRHDHSMEARSHSSAGCPAVDSNVLLAGLPPRTPALHPQSLFPLMPLFPPRGRYLSASSPDVTGGSPDPNRLHSLSRLTTPECSAPPVALMHLDIQNPRPDTHSQRSIIPTPPLARQPLACVRATRPNKPAAL